MKQILLVDNDVRFLKGRAESLRKAGYEVLEAETVEAAERLLGENRVHLAIIDIRLVNEHDEKDVSGLTLAKKADYKHVPKIILTKHPTYEAVREAMSGALEGLSPAVYFLAKDEGAQAMVDAVGKVFLQHLRINWELFIQPSEGNPVDFLHLAGLIEKDLHGRLVLNRADELEDLFRSLFYEMSQIRIERLLWKREGRVAVTVFAFADGKAPEAFIVTCGRRRLVEDEKKNYYESAPKSMGLFGSMLDKSGGTSHYAANAYVLTGASLESLQPLIELYRAGSEKSFHAAVSNLFEQTLRPWHKKAAVSDRRDTLGQVYCECLGWSQDALAGVNFGPRIHSLIHQIPVLGSRLQMEAGALKVEFGGQSFSYADPTNILNKLSEIDYPFVASTTPGMITGDNVLTDSPGQTWLTDFAGAGSAPELLDYVSLEAMIRFDWVEVNKIQWLHEMERALVDGDFGRVDTAAVEPVLRKPIRAIQTVRRLASNVVSKNPEPYHLGILCQAARRLADFNPAYRLMPNELARLAHLLVAAAIIGEKLGANKRAPADSSTAWRGIRIDRANYAVRIDGVKIQLRGQSYHLLCYLYDRRNKLCTRRELIENVFQETYRDRDDSQVSKLNTAIRRLREKIEDNPDHPRYLLTEPGGGYRLSA
ncbi:MAG: winged helix-turn-helix domain-containing protein [Blastocatellia bacterium]